MNRNCYIIILNLNVMYMDEKTKESVSRMFKCVVIL